MKDFLNPKSMLTPGAAGALIMFLVNGLCFTFPELAPRYVALGLSFVIGGLAVSGGTIKPLERVVYWFLNSLIIFCMGMGTANLASSAAGAPKAPVGKQAQVSGSWFISSAVAETTPAIRPTIKVKPKVVTKPKKPTASEVKSMQELQVQLLEQQKMIEALRQQNLKMQQKQAPSTTQAPVVAPPPPKAPQEQRFFKSW